MKWSIGTDLALFPLPKAYTSALYPYTRIRAFTDLNVTGRRSVGQKVPFLAVHVFLGSPFKPWMKTISTRASGCTYTSVTSNRFISSRGITEPCTQVKSLSLAPLSAKSGDTYHSRHILMCRLMQWSRILLYAQLHLQSITGATRSTQDPDDVVRRTRTCTCLTERLRSVSCVCVPVLPVARADTLSHTGRFLS